MHLPEELNFLINKFQNFVKAKIVSFTPQLFHRVPHSLRYRLQIDEKLLTAQLPLQDFEGFHHTSSLFMPYHIHYVFNTYKLFQASRFFRTSSSTVTKTSAFLTAIAMCTASIAFTLHSTIILSASFAVSRQFSEFLSMLSVSTPQLLLFFPEKI